MIQVLVGIQALSYRSSSCRIFIFFQKINLRNFCVTWNKINSSSDLVISYPSITQTQIKHMPPTSFKFRVNSYIKTILSKTRENSRLKTRYLKGITTEQLFIMSIKSLFEEKVLYSQLCLFYFIGTKNITFCFILSFILYIILINKIKHKKVWSAWGSSVGLRVQSARP